jgi:hypothetical protein
MLRVFLASALGLILCGGLALADDAKPEKKKGGGASGVIKKVDASAGVLTVTIKNKKNPDGMDKEYKISDSVKFVVVDGEAKVELPAKDGLKSDKLKEGASVRIETNDKGDVTTVTIGGGKKKGK